MTSVLKATSNQNVPTKMLLWPLDFLSLKTQLLDAAGLLLYPRWEEKILEAYCILFPLMNALDLLQTILFFAQPVFLKALFCILLS